MTLETFVQLGVLALIDSTSIGTLVIPVWLLMRRDAGRTTGKVATFFELPAVQVLMVAAGAGMLIWSFKDTSLKGTPNGGGENGVGAAADGTPANGTGSGGGGRSAAVLQRSRATEHRWQRRIGKALDSRGGLLGLALLAGVLELPTMLPYLAAVGVLTSAGAGWSVSAGMLALYCLVMLLPALLLVLLRCVLGRHLDGPLERLRAWLTKVSGEAVLWVVGIVGFLMLRAGLAGLFPDASWNPFGG
jgi:cytochrome c biogenesis protein CcdA